VGAPESNAGDDFHFWWAASRALELIRPGTELCRVTLEGPASVDDADEQYETVDVAEYYGSHTVPTADALVLSQLKYSTRHPNTAWTAARMCQPRSRRRADGTATAARSVIADLAAAFLQLRTDHGIEATAKARVALVSNQPGDPLLLTSVTAAAAWVRERSGTPRRAALLAALSPPHAAAVQSLSDAVGTRLNGGQFCAFLVALDFTQTGSLERAALAHAVRVSADELTPGRAPDSARRLFHLVRNEAMPESSRRGVTEADVLAALEAPELIDLYPAPPRLEDLTDPLPAPGAAAVAHAAVAHLGSLVVAHGPAGAGKTTALRQVLGHLPPGSKLLLFDCYGGGDYLSSGEERHTPQRFAMQVINEIGQQCGTPLLLQPPAMDADLWRRFNRTLDRAVATLDQDAVLVLGIDAADNAMVAARERGDRGFLPDLVRLRLPDRVAVVLTSRSHRVASLGVDGKPKVELAPFDAATSAAHLRRHCPEATHPEAADFHDRTGGNPRAQFYALTQADTNGWDMPALLQACSRTPEPVFADLLASALQVSGADAGGSRWLALMLALARPVDRDTMAAALHVDPVNVDTFAAGLAPGVRLAGGAIQFRDEDFETYVRERVDPADVTAAHHQLAEMFLASRPTDPDAAAQVAEHLYAAGRLDDLLGLVLNEDAPVGIADGFRREQVQGRRLDLAARAAAHIGSAAVAVRVAARGCDTASRLDTLSRLVESHLDLVARYADLDLLRGYALRQDRSTWLGPVRMRLAAALSRDPERHAAARDELDNADAWLHRWITGRDDETRHWDVAAEDVAAAAEARYRLGGVPDAIDELRRWRPAAFALDAAARLAARVAGELTPEDARDALQTNGVLTVAQAPVLAYVSTGRTAVDSTWVHEVIAALLAEPPGKTRPWHSRMLDAALRHGDRQAAAALARHWAVALPTHGWGFAGAAADGTFALRCHATAAVVDGVALALGSLIPAALAPPQAKTEGGYVDDPRGHERREWTEIVEPLAAASTLLARIAVDGASGDDVVAFVEAGLASRTGRAQHRWFTYDLSYRVWATLTAQAIVEAHAPAALIDRLANVAPTLLREGAPGMWLDIAEWLTSRGQHGDVAADLCARAAEYASTEAYPATDRLELVARAAEVAATVAPELGRQLFGKAVGVATGINDDAARLLKVHADLAGRAEIATQARAAVAARLIQAAEAIAPHVTESGVVPYEALAGAAARLHLATGLAAASRWDDEDRVRLTSTLPVALTAAVDGDELQPWQALALDHFIEDCGRRLDYQLDIVTCMLRGGADATANARVALSRTSDWLRRDVAAPEQPALAHRLLDTAAKHGLDGHIRTALEAVCELEVDPDRVDRTASRSWHDDVDAAAAAQSLIDDPGARGWSTLVEDVATLDAAYIYGDELRAFVASVVQASPVGDRIAALDALAALPHRHAVMTLPVLADTVETWQTWPGVSQWARAALPILLTQHLSDLAWRQDTNLLARELRAFADDDTIRSAVLLALPVVRPRLTAFGWQNIAALLASLCSRAEAADALLGLLQDRVPDDEGEPTDIAESEPGVAMLIWSACGHPRRAVRWRAAHAVRDLLAHPDHTVTAPLAASLVRCLDRTGAAAYRDPTLHFYRLSAMAGLLVGLQRVAVERPGLLAPHLSELVRHATSRDLPHAQIRELARQAALAVAGPTDPRLRELHSANQPTCCYASRENYHERNDRRVSDDRRYHFDPMDTLPYWYAPLAHVFDVPLDDVAKTAEAWLLDRWGFGEDDWMTDRRELRDQRSWERMSHRQGSIPPEEKLHLYIEYHAMMVAAGELADNGRPVRVGTWNADDGDPWQYWLARHLTKPDRWLADLRAAAPSEPELFGQPAPIDDAWGTPVPADHDRALGLVDGKLSEPVLVAASTSLRQRKGRESIYIRSAVVAPDHAADLQRALASASNPHDWRLPEEDEKEFEVGHGTFELRGWLVETREEHEGLDEHDPYAHGIRVTVPLPGRRFRETAHATFNPTSLLLLGQDGSVVARVEQWADPDADLDTLTSVASSGYRVSVDRAALLHHLAQTDTNLIVEVQIGRHRSDCSSSEYRAPYSRIYLVDATGRVTRR